MVIRPTATPPNLQTIKSKFVQKTFFEKIYTVENGFWHNDPNMFAKNMFGENWFYTLHDPYKTIAYYEKNLEETGSIEFRHFQDKNTDTINYSTAKLIRIIHPTEWNPNPISPVKFNVSVTQPVPYRPSYTYFDYQQAWWNVFFRQNINLRHTWLFYFEENFDISQIPYWYLRWWECFGPLQETLHNTAQAGYKIFLKKYKPLPVEEALPPLMIYFIIFRVSWVTAWEFDYTKSTNDPNILVLTENIRLNGGMASNFETESLTKQ